MKCYRRACLLLRHLKNIYIYLFLSCFSRKQSAGGTDEGVDEGHDLFLFTRANEERQ
ncbi:unnamed protein product, partial [Ascophyllum nodosum]